MRTSTASGPTRRTIRSPMSSTMSRSSSPRGRVLADDPSARPGVGSPAVSRRCPLQPPPRRQRHDDDRCRDRHLPRVNRQTPRRWLRRLAVGLVGLMVLVSAGYGWAWLSLDRSTAARAMLWMDSDVGDQYRFPSRDIPAGAVPGPLPRGVEVDPSTPPVIPADTEDIDD